MELDTNGFFDALRQEREYKQALEILKKDKEEEDMTWKDYETDFGSIPSRPKLKLTDLQEAKVSGTKTQEGPRAISSLEYEYTKALLNNERFMAEIVNTGNRTASGTEMGLIIQSLVQKLIK